MTLLMRKWPNAALLAAAGAIASIAALGTDARAAGVVEVSFVNPEKFADIGRLVADRQRTLDGLQRHFKSLGDQLPDGQALRIEVLDVDLAGELEMTVRLGGEQRVLKGRADWPRMTLRYTLTAGGTTLKSGRDQLSDMAYLDSRAVPPTATSEALYHETRMIDRWFGQNFVPRKPRPD
jgi:hypothetical protein